MLYKIGTRKIVACFGLVQVFTVPYAYEVQISSANPAPSADFCDAKPLMNSEVAQILEHKRHIMQRKGVQPKKYVCYPVSVRAPVIPRAHTLSDFLKAYQYVNTVKQFRDREVVAQVRRCVPVAAHSRHGRRLSSHAHCRDLENHSGLEPFELAQLGNLCPQGTSEAKALIPSLDMQGRDLGNAQLTEILDQLNASRQYSHIA